MVAWKGKDVRMRMHRQLKVQAGRTSRQADAKATEKTIKALGKRAAELQQLRKVRREDE
jgi:hypothetical protein